MCYVIIVASYLMTKQNQKVLNIKSVSRESYNVDI